MRKELEEIIKKHDLKFIDKDKEEMDKLPWNPYMCEKGELKEIKEAACNMFGLSSKSTDKKKSTNQKNSKKNSSTEKSKCDKKDPNKQKKRDESNFLKCKEFIDESKAYCDFLGFFSKPKEKEKESNMKTNSIHGSPPENNLIQNESNQIGIHQQDNINDVGDVSDPNAESYSKANHDKDTNLSDKDLKSVKSKILSKKSEADMKGIEYINNLKARNSKTNKNKNYKKL